jgi:hypothetical protein
MLNGHERIIYFYVQRMRGNTESWSIQNIENRTYSIKDVADLNLVVQNAAFKFFGIIYD